MSSTSKVSSITYGERIIRKLTQDWLAYECRFLKLLLSTDPNQERVSKSTDMESGLQARGSTVLTHQKTYAVFSRPFRHLLHWCLPPRPLTIEQRILLRSLSATLACTHTRSVY